MSFKGNPSEMEGNMNSLIGLVCFMLPRIIGMVDGLDPCLNYAGISICAMKNSGFEQVGFFLKTNLNCESRKLF